ncbi:hypothetical protein [Micromonospora sp. NPDC023644]|uniref:hypothetical protein n=1 Tax=Micromonospora sp. NPDC023644 TaxID=3154321 RepID=UPI0034106684
MHDRWSAALVVDPHDPYFFDHPLDHLPGMALVCGLFELLRSADVGIEGTRRQMLVSLRFPLFCELGDPVGLEAVVPAPARSVAFVGHLAASGGDGASTAGDIGLRAFQGETTVCEGTVGFRTGEPSRPEVPGTRVSAPAPPADPALVHRQHPENVLISAMDADYSVAVRRPPPGHPLAGPPGAPARVELVVDAARQFATMINHVAGRSRPGATFVLLDLDADLPGDLSGDIALNWTPEPAARGRLSLTIRVLVDGVPRGHVGFRYYVATPAVYDRLRRPTASTGRQA